MRVVVIGTGYVGLVSAAGLAEFGNDVVCVGFNPERIAQLSQGEVGFYEPGLKELISSNLEAGRVRFADEVESAIVGAEVIIYAKRVKADVDGGADLGRLFAVADIIGKRLDRYTVVALKSTVPVGTCDRLAARIGAHAQVPFGVASTPAFLKEGDAINDFMKPDRVVIGSDDERAIETLRKLYDPFVRTQDRVIVCDARSAELAKQAASALLASRISFINELAMLADELGADIERVRHIMGADARIGPKALFVSPGFGGSHFHSDIDMLLSSARDAGRQLMVVRAAHEANQDHKRVLLTKLERNLGALEGKTVALWGLSFKPRTDDTGEGPALKLIEGLLAAGASVRAHDPKAMERVGRIFGSRIHLGSTMYDAVTGADALVLVTEWHQYRRPDFERVAAAMRGKLVIDGRNIWNPEELRGLGLRYVGLGRR